MIVLPSDMSPPECEDSMAMRYFSGAEIPGAMTLMLLSSAVSALFQWHQVQLLFFASAGFASGSIVEKSFSRYNSTDLFARALVTVDHRVPRVRLVAAAAVFAASFMFPIAANVCACVLGFCAGVLASFAQTDRAR